MNKFWLKLVFSMTLAGGIFTPFAIRSLPPQDFEWLKPFYVMYETVRPGHWENNPAMKFDNNGIVTVNGKNYNPVTVSQYALVCFDYFRDTGNERFKKAFLNQVSWLTNDTVYKEKDNKIIYSYNYSFHDLQPGWTSGLAHAEVISVLIRYYYLERKPETLEMIKKVCNYMLAPVEEDGCLKRTPEGGWWIEEYVKSKQHVHVLNGNMVSIISLYEYIKLFPDDKRAADLYPQLLESLKKSVDFYDTGSGLRYDRGGGNVVAPWYMKAQVIEMKTLYRLTGDLFYHRKMMHWMTYCYNKSVGMIDCIINDLNFATPVIFDADNNLVMACESSVMLNATNSVLSIYPDSRKHATTNLVDNIANTFCQFLISDTVSQDPYADVILTNPAVANQLRISYRKGSVRPEIRQITGVTGERERKALKTTRIKSSDSEIQYYDFPSVMLSGFRVEFQKPDTSFMVNDINISNTEQKVCSEYVYYQSKVTACDSTTFRIDAKTDQVEDLAIYYRQGNTAQETGTRAWNYISSSFPAEGMVNKGFYQVLVVAKPGSKQNFRIKKFSVTPPLTQ